MRTAGSAGANTETDRVRVPDEAVSQLPAHIARGYHAGAGPLLADQRRHTSSG